MGRENYEGQIFGTRKIIQNYCVDDDWIKIGKKIPKEKSKYRLSECLCCGKQIPVLVSKLKQNPPKKCSFCSGINNQSTQTDRNKWINCNDYYILSISYQDKQILTYIDKEDFPKVSQKIWRISKKKQKYYVVTGSKEQQTYLHQYVLNQKPIKGYEIDHIDGNSLNNRKENLRIVTRLENIQNSNAKINNQIGIRGISKTKSNKFKVDFSYNKQRYYFPNWNSLIEAVYCRLYAEQFFGLQILQRNPLFQDFLSFSEKDKERIKNITISIINNTKVSVEKI